MANELMEDTAEIRRRISASRARWIDNLGSNGARGADNIAEFADKLPSGAPKPTE